MGILEPITHKQEIEEIYSKAEFIQSKSINRFNDAKEKAESKLEEYGKQKVLVFGNCISNFCSIFKTFKNVEIKAISSNTNQIMRIDTGEQLALIGENAKYSNDLLKIGLVSIGAGTLTSLAAFGGTKMIVGAPAGAKVAGFAAKSVATKAATVASFVFVPAIIVFGIFAGIKGKEKLAKAKSDLAKVEAEAKKTDMYSRVYEEIVEVLHNYSNFVSSFKTKYVKVLDRLKEISLIHQKDDSGKIDFASLSEVEQRTLHLSWLMTQLYYGVLKQPLINEEGKAIQESKTALVEAQNTYKQIKKQYPDEVFKVAENPNEAARGWLIASFVFFGLSLLLSSYCFYSNKISSGLVFIATALLSFPFSMFIKKIPTRLKIFIRVMRLLLVITSTIIVFVYLF
ncbi:MAG: hypothetical protein SO007_05585 [Candidatus Enteromonas sp.]|nr:hypothetical protein [Candidatus Enteromonas sp.]